MESIVGDVQADLEKLIGVAEHSGQFLREVGVDLNIGTTRLRQAELHRRLYQGIYVDQRLLRWNLLGETQQTGNQGPRPAYLLFDLLHERALLAAELCRC